MQLAIGTADNPDLAKETIEDLREEVESLKRELRAVTISRDTYQTENNQLRKQCTMYQKKLKAAGL
jgi:FtsZ-binding cell division protein ZapB